MLHDKVSDEFQDNRERERDIKRGFNKGKCKERRAITIIRINDEGKRGYLSYIVQDKMRNKRHSLTKHQGCTASCYIPVNVRHGT